MKIKKGKKRVFSKIISILLMLVSIFYVGLIFYIDLFPMKYELIVSIVSLLFVALNIFLLNIKNLKKKIKKVTYVFSIIGILVMTFISFYACRTLGVLNNNGDSKYKLEHYSVIALKDSEYSKIVDIKNTNVGYLSTAENVDTAKEKLKNKVKVKYTEYSTTDELFEDLKQSNIKAIMIEDSIKSIMSEGNEEFDKLTKVIYTFTIKVETNSNAKDVNVTKKPFAIYISGIDTYGEISSVSRSDVNMVMVVNPNTYQILLISIPRDYYVQLHGTTGYKDKLTHAGMYGVDMSIETIEDLLDCDINYYVKVNFTSVIDIVDALGGVDVYSEYDFISYSNFRFKKGMNSVNGEKALDFARTRKAFATGDRQRGKNQQALIQALVEKASSKSIITNYNSLLSAIDGKYQTNMSTRKITSLIKMQIKDMPTWNITSYSLTGTDAKNYTHSSGQLLYVMEPDEESVEEAKLMIDKTLKGESLEAIEIEENQ